MTPTPTPTPQVLASVVTDDLRLLPQRAADLIDRVGWTQETERDAAGRVCLTDGLRFCDSQPGDWLIAREVFRQRDRAENWNDAPGRTKDEVQVYLRSVEIAAAELAKTFGPQWESIVALIRTAATLTPQQGNELYVAAGYAAYYAAGYAARVPAGYAAGYAARVAARVPAGYAAGYAARDAARVPAWYAAGYAARALVVRDLIGQHGFTQEHYDLLVSPWVSVMGPAHPDDKPVTA